MDPILLTTVLTSLIPAAVDGVKAWVSKKTDNKPAVLTADDYAKIADVDIRRLEALDKLDDPNGEVYPWVASVRAMQRPFVVAAVLVAWLGCVFLGCSEEKFILISQLASAVFFYLFGERTNMYIKGRA